MAKKKKASPRSTPKTARRPKKAPSNTRQKAALKTAKQQPARPKAKAAAARSKTAVRKNVTAKRTAKSTAAPKTSQEHSAETSGPAPRGATAQDLVPIVGIGASAGGLEAFTELLKAVPTDTGMAFVLVSHLSHSHKSMLTELLARSTEMPLSQVTKAAPLRPNHVYVIPPNKDLVISDGIIKPQRIAKLRRPHMAIDHFFRSLAEHRGSQAVGVVLSGTGTDGTLGLAAIKAEGGITFVQDERSAKYPDMPRSAGSGAVRADFVLDPGQIAAELARIAQHPYLAGGKQPEHTRPVAAPDSGPGLDQIFALVRGATGVDFSHYKPATIKRRITRRMLLHRVESVGRYIDLLRRRAGEIDALYQDLLINVTGFFRDPETFKALQKKIIPKILGQQQARKFPLRVWIPGCATGEEAYSIAICMLEALGDYAANPPLQVFGTDVSAAAIHRAREGVFPENIASDVSPERLRRFFTKTDRGYQISKLVRDLCVFATQNVVKDPPFSWLDLISCRNVLIYFGPPLQKKVLTTFHYALKPTGFLLLGTSETVGPSSELFQLVDKKHKICSKLQTAIPPHLDFGARELEPVVFSGGKKAAKEMREATDVSREADRIVITKHSPPGVVVNSALHIVQFRGSTSPFLEPAPGEASFHLLKMAREGLLIDLRAALHEARKTKRPVRKEGLRVRLSGEMRLVNLEVSPLETPALTEEYYLVLFEQGPEQETPAPVPPPSDRSKGRHRTQAKAQREITTLREELAASQADLHAIIEGQEANNEELQSANEEILSSNEELQSTNEELETAKEELQATNEELTTVNEELRNRNSEIGQAHNDLLNLVSSVDIVIVMLGTDLRIRLFTPAAQRVLNLISSDVGRPLSDIKPNLKLSDLDKLIAEVVDTITVKERDVQDLRGRWYSMRIKPYKTADNKIEGAVLTLVDIDDLKRAVERLDLYSRVFMTETSPIIIQDLEGRIIELNQEAERAYGWSRGELLGNPIKMIIPPDRHSYAEELWERCKQARSIRQVRDFRWSKARQRIPVELTLNLLTDDEGEPVAMATIARHKSRS